MKPLTTKKTPPTREKINPKEIRKSYLDKMEDELASQGVVFFDPQEGNLNIQEDYLALPPEITEVPSRELGEYLNAFTQQKIYLRTVLGRVELCVEEARREYYESSKEYYRRYSLDKMSETAKERLINSQDGVKPFYYKYKDMQRKQELIEHSIANIEDAVFLLSREVTRRTGDFENENRANNVKNMRR